MTQRCQSSNVVGGQCNGMPMLHDNYNCYIGMTVEGHGKCLGGHGMSLAMACHVILYMGHGGALDESMVEIGAQGIGTHAPITSNFPSSSSHKVVGDYVEK